MSVPVAAVVWLALGALAPVIISLYSSNSVQHDAVVAAPGHSFTISNPVVLSRSPDVRLERGTIVLVDPSGRPISSTAAVGGGRTALPPGSTANLLLDNALLTISGVDHPVGKIVASAISAAGGLAIDPVPGHADANVHTGPLTVGRSNPEPEASDTAASYLGANVSDALAPLVEALSAARYDNLLLRRTTIIIRLSNAAGAAAAEPMNDVNATVSVRRKGTTVLKGSGLVRGERINFDVSAHSLPSERRATDARLGLKFAIRAPSIDVAFDGRLGTEGGLELQGQGELSMKSVRQLARWFGASWSRAAGLRDVNARGQVEFAKQTLRFEQAAFKIDGSEATGALAVGFGGPRPQLTGTLAFRSLDVGKYFDHALAEPRDPMSWSSIVAGAMTAPLGLNLDADFRVSAEQTQVFAFDIGRSAATVAIKDGRLLADIAEFSFGGGQGRGQIGADFSAYQPKVTLRGRIEGVELGGLTTAIAGAALVHGGGTITADLAGVGATAPDLLSTLSGKLAIRSHDGGRLAIDLKQLSGAVQTRDVVGWGLAANLGRTSFDTLDLRLVVRDGVLLTETADISGPDGGWTVTGVVNLPAQRLDLSVAPALGGPAVRAGVTSIRPTVLEVRGPWTQPLIRSLSEPTSAAKPALEQKSSPATGAPRRG